MARIPIHPQNCVFSVRSPLPPFLRVNVSVPPYPPPSELQSNLDLRDARRIDLRAHPAEVGVGDVRLDPAEHDGVEDVEHVHPEPELHPRDWEIPSHADVLIEGARIAESVRQRARRIAERKGLRRLKCRAIDVGWRIRAEYVAIPVVAVDA